MRHVARTFKFRGFIVTTVQQKKMPIVWTISASAAGGGTGIQADLHTFHDFDVYGWGIRFADNARM